MKTHLVIPDQHAHPDYNNDRADYLGKFIKELKPDLVVNMGDAADLPSLSTHEKSFAFKSYEKDIESHLEFQDRLWTPFKRSKKKQPHKVVLEGNHEFRIKRTLEAAPHLGGVRVGLSFRDLEFDKYYNDVVEYKGHTPGVIELDGVSYAHYFITGISGRPISGDHHAHSLIAKNHTSCVAAHSHCCDYSIRHDTKGRRIQGLVCGVYQDYEAPWAGHMNDLWWRGVVVLRNVEDGQYDPQFISLESLKKEYTK